MKSNETLEQKAYELGFFSVYEYLKWLYGE